MLGTLALVGSPNSGKSTLFNRIVGERKSIVLDTPGVTRDRIYSRATWLTKEFTIIDTGGIEIKTNTFHNEIRAQAEIAIQEADVICFVLDGKKGLSGDDRAVARLLYDCGKPIILAVNKIDSFAEVADAGEFYALGLGEPMAISAIHGIGIGDLLDKVISLLPEKEDREYGDAVTFALIGVPNVGKSSLANRLLGDPRSIVSPISGTTRDSIDTPFERNGRRYVVIDTAGLVKRGKIYEAVDKYAALRALRAIDRSDVAVLLIDATKGLVEQDKHVVGYAVESGKAIVVAINKWDAEKHLPEDEKNFREKIQTGMKFLDYASVCFISALTGRGIDILLDYVSKAAEGYRRRIPTGILNDIIREAQVYNPTPDFNHGRLKIYYASQVAVAPPTFVMFCNNPEFAHFSYTRYLENRLRESFDFEGSPIHIIYRLRK